MPRTLQELLDDQERLAQRLHDYEPSPDDERDPAVFRALISAAAARADAESEVVDAVRAARASGYSWALIASILGTTGQAAQKRYGPVVSHGS